MALDVYVNNRLSGVLEETDPYKFRFTYATGADESQRVSLIMPTGRQVWTFGALHPVFQVSLPEGRLRDFLTAKQEDALVRV